jgi:hypothetical protein
VGARGGGFEPDEQAGEGRLGHGQVHRADHVHPAARAARAELALRHDAARAEDGHFLLGGRPARHHGQVTTREGLLGAHREAEDAIPVELIELVGGQAQAPRPAGPAQAALDPGAAAFEQEPPHGDAGGGQDKQDQEGGEEPGRIERQRLPQPKPRQA